MKLSPKMRHAIKMAMGNGGRLHYEMSKYAPYRAFYYGRELPTNDPNTFVLPRTIKALWRRGIILNKPTSCNDVIINRDALAALEGK